MTWSSSPPFPPPIAASVKALRAAWTEIGIEPENIVEDFIAVLPVYAWSVEKRGDVDVGVEKKTGYRMQSNIHLAVNSSAQAQAAFTRAFEQGITDIIAFDYWSKELDEIKVQTRSQALQAARDKSALLLGVLFAERPPVINVQEHTTIRYPVALYHSFTNAYAEGVTPNWRREMPYIHAYRPQNTYYRGLYIDGDVQPRDLPMNPEIAVISTVRLYYQSPAAKRAKDDDDDE